MQPREKTLAAVLAGLVALLAVWLGAGRVREALAVRTGRIDALERDVRDKQFQGELGARAAEELAAWQARSLPADPNLALTLYQNWLVGLADQARLRDIVVEAGRPTTQRNIYIRLNFTVRARASLEQAARFMHDFYRAPHLHQIRAASLKPLEGSRDLDLSFIIEALSLPGADRLDRLSEVDFDRLAPRTWSDYRGPIVDRNLFAAYTPPPPPRTTPIVTERRPEPPRPPSFDPARHAVLTAVVEVDQEPEAWISVRVTGEVLRVRTGDALSVGQMQATVASIGVNWLVLESEGQQRLLSLGQALTEAVPLESSSL